MKHKSSPLLKIISFHILDFIYFVKVNEITMCEINGIKVKAVNS